VTSFFWRESTAKKTKRKMLLRILARSSSSFAKKTHNELPLHPTKAPTKGKLILEDGGEYKGFFFGKVSFSLSLFFNSALECEKMRGALGTFFS
jgi:hypothetical protein